MPSAQKTTRSTPKRNNPRAQKKKSSARAGLLAQAESAASTALPLTTITRQQKMKRRLLGGVLVCLIVGLVLVVGVLGAYARMLERYQYAFFPGVHVGDMNVSGMSYLEAYDAVESRVNTVLEKGIPVQYRNAKTAAVATNGIATAIITPTIVPLSSAEYEQEVFGIDFTDSLNQAYTIGRSGDWSHRIGTQWHTWRRGKKVDIASHVNQVTVKELIAENFRTFETQPVNADIIVHEDQQIDILPEHSGLTFDYTAAAEQVAQHITAFDTHPVVIALQTTAAPVSAEEVRAQLPIVERYLKRTPLTLTWENRQWTFDAATVGSWLSFASGVLAIDTEKMSGSISDSIGVIGIAPHEGRWQIEKNEDATFARLTELQTAVAGRMVDVDETALRVISMLHSSAPIEPVSIATTDAAPQFTTDTVDALAVQELLGTGWSSIKGSTYNRRSNVTRGINLLHGLLLAPGEEFSLLRALKPFTSGNGYVAELVIKGDKTTPEIGGGLCQVGTTLFRATMNSGLDILKRTNHAFAVGYYSDPRNGNPGTDATIYDPAPDYAFKNNTDHYVLIQSRVNGDDVVIEFWGTSDGRKGSFSAPAAYNWVSPQPTKETPTTELAPGARTCTENAHAGVTTEFTYTIEQSDGTKTEEVFKSVYKPWQAVCLVGVAPTEQDTAASDTEEDAVDDNPTNTNAGSNTNSNTDSKNTNKNKKKKK